MGNIDKIVYEDGKVKVIKGVILDEDEFTITIRASDYSVLTIGKRAIIQINRRSSK